MTSTSIKQYRRRSSCGTIALVAAAIMTSSTSASNQCHHFGSVIPHRSSTLLSASIDREMSRATTMLDRRLNAIDNPSVEKYLDNNVVTYAVNSTYCTTTCARIFFQEQQDLVSEIFSFLDVQSLLIMCSHVITTKSVVPISSLLRYDHIIQSALSLTSSNTTADRRLHNSETTCNYNGVASSTTSSATRTIMKKLIQVFHIDNNVDNVDKITTCTVNTTAVSSSTPSSPSLLSSSLPLYLPMKQKPPSPLRLLQLVNGRNCEKCHCQLSPHVLAVGNNEGCSSGGIVLPSLSFGRFCCTQCIF